MSSDRYRLAELGGHGWINRFYGGLVGTGEEVAGMEGRTGAQHRIIKHIDGGEKKEIFRTFSDVCS